MTHTTVLHLHTTQYAQIQSGSTWDEDDEQEGDEQEEEQDKDGTGEGLWLDDDDDDDEEGEEEQDTVISAEEGVGVTPGLAAAAAAAAAATPAGADDVLSRPVPCWRDARLPVIPDEYTATVVLETACLSIDRRPNNLGLELSVMAEGLTVLDEAPALQAAQEERERATALPAPVPVKVGWLIQRFWLVDGRYILTFLHTSIHRQILFPSSEVLPPSPAADGDAAPATATTKLPGHLQVRYAQQNIGPYRRCSVQVARSVVAAAGDRIIRLVDFFLAPIRERNAKLPPPAEEQPRYVNG